MTKDINSFLKTKEYLICIDSDGCAIDSMTIKHEVAFGPVFIHTFGLEKYQDELLKEWNRINLYSRTRGINRFKGLNMILHYCNDNFQKIDNLLDFDIFCNTTDAFSNDAMKTYMESHPSPILDKALNWSIGVNEKISLIDESKINTFKHVKETIELLSKFADIAVVSSANFNAIWGEWDRLGILKYVDCFTSQQDGSKEICINKLLYKGYQSNNVIMFGDGPLDLEAARHNGVYFYPILCSKEDKSWEEALKYVSYLKDHTFGEYQEELIDKFMNNLEK